MLNLEALCTVNGSNIHCESKKKNNTLEEAKANSVSLLKSSMYIGT